MRKLILFLAVAAFVFSPWMVAQAGAGQRKPAHAKHHHTKHHHPKHHKKN